MAMTMVSARKVYREAEGDWYLAVISATEDPASGNITGADVTGANDDDKFAAGSVVITPDSNWIAFEDGVFSAKS